MKIEFQRRFDLLAREPFYVENVKNISREEKFFSFQIVLENNPMSIVSWYQQKRQAVQKRYDNNRESITQYRKENYIEN